MNFNEKFNLGVVLLFKDLLNGGDGNINSSSDVRKKILFFLGNVILNNFRILVCLFFGDQRNKFIFVHFMYSLFYLNLGISSYKLTNSYGYEHKEMAIMFGSPCQLGQINN